MNDAMTEVDRIIPARLNMVLSMLAWALAAIFLWLASHTSGIAFIMACAGFALINNTVFSLLHESVHGIFHTDPFINDWFGRISAAFFPTGFLIQRICHLGHHRRNRTDAELFDYCPPGVPMALARFRLLCLLTGFFWSSAPLGSLLYITGAFRRRLFRERIADFYGLRPMVEDVCSAPPRRISAEILFAICFQIILVMVLDLSLVGWFACYWSFALLWCSVQYSTHAWAPRDIQNGAWNLHTGRFTSLVFLNYHCHLAHHQNPDIPWIYLPGLVQKNIPRLSWIGIYLSLWKGPRHTEEPDPRQISSKLSRKLEISSSC